MIILHFKSCTIKVLILLYYFNITKTKKQKWTKMQRWIILLTNLNKGDVRVENSKHIKNKEMKSNAYNLHIEIKMIHEGSLDFNR